MKASDRHLMPSMASDDAITPPNIGNRPNEAIIIVADDLVHLPSLLVVPAPAHAALVARGDLWALVDGVTVKVAVAVNLTSTGIAAALTHPLICPKIITGRTKERSAIRANTAKVRNATSVVLRITFRHNVHKMVGMRLACGR